MLSTRRHVDETGLKLWAVRFAEVSQWPVENGVRPMFCLEPYWEAAERKIWSGTQSVLSKQLDVDVVQLAVTRLEMIAALRPLSRLRCDPLNLTGEQDVYFRFFALYVVRRLLPYEPYQSDGTKAAGPYKPTLYMELFSVLCIAADWMCSVFVLMDDKLDGTRVRESSGIPWVHRYEHSASLDTLLVTMVSQRAVSDCLPVSHPNYGKICAAMQDYQTAMLEYFNYHCELMACNSVPAERHSFVEDLIQNYTQDTFTSYVANRAAKYYQLLFRLPLLYACYDDAAVRPESGWGNVILVMNEVICMADDMVDNCVALQGVTDIASGEPSNIYFFGFMQDIAHEEDPAVKERLRAALQDWFGTHCEEDARKLRDLWEERDILRRWVKPFAGQVMRPRWMILRQEALEQVNFPVDLLWASVCYLLRQDQTMKPEQAARLLNYVCSEWESAEPGHDPVLGRLDYCADPLCDFPVLPPQQADLD